MPKPIIFLRDKIAEMVKETHQISRSAFAAVVLLLMASALTLSVVIGLRDGQGLAVERENSPVKPPEAKAIMEIQTQTAILPAPKTAAVPAPKAQQAAVPAQEAPKTETAVLEKPYRPLTGETAVQYGWQMHPVFRDWRFHNGIDIAGREGEAVSAVWSGEVKEIFQDKTTGLTVAVRSGDYTVYYGCLATAKVRKGDKIKAGTTIGTVGTSSGEPYPHLHLALKQGENYIDPAEKIVSNRR